MGKIRKVRCCGDSMVPTLPKESSVIEIETIKDAKFETKIGDIVSYHSIGFNRNGKHSALKYPFGEEVCHRIIGKSEAFALIKGDNREYVEKVLYKNINGIVRLPPPDKSGGFRRVA